jgi:hypothetical protein
MRYMLWFFAGALLAGAGALAIGILAMDQGWVSNREGAAAMGIVFFITPAGALVGGILGVILAAVRQRQP